jgi:hypothetical protein
MNTLIGTSAAEAALEHGQRMLALSLEADTKDDR